MKIITEHICNDTLAYTIVTILTQTPYSVGEGAPSITPRRFVTTLQLIPAAAERLVID